MAEFYSARSWEIPPLPWTNLSPPFSGTAQREGLRRYHMGVVVPMARLLEAELSEKFNVAIRLKFDSYATDMVARAQVFSKLAGVEGISPEMAMALAQIGDGADG